MNFLQSCRNFPINLVIIYYEKEGGNYLIILYRQIPYALLQLEALARWMPQNHRQYTQLLDEIGRRKGGFYGEQRLDYFLKFLPEERYHIFQGVRLIGKYGAFQIDCLILSTNFILIIEVKNFSDEVHFDKNFNQVIRKSRIKGEKSFQDPIAQAHRHEVQLKNYIRTHKIKMPPIETLVCISNASTKITTDDQNERVLQKVFHAEHVLEKVAELEKKHTEQTISQKTLQKLSNCILAGNTPLREDIFKTYKISRDELGLRVGCPSCYSDQMSFKSGNWYCTSCSKISNDAHEKLIYDYLLLINPIITNKQCSALLRIQSRYSVHRILSKMPLSSSGHTKARKYFLPESYDKIIKV
jgi:hypothetical protein